MKSIIHKIKKYKFKKVNYFDLAVFTILVVIISIFLYNRYSKKSIWINTRVLISNSEWWWSGEAPPYWLVDSLEEGLISYNSFGEDVAEVTDVEIFSLGGPHKQAFIDLKLKVSYDKNRQIYLYNFQPIQKGKPIDLTFGSNNVNGLIIALDQEPEDIFTKKITVRMQHLEDWLAESYQVGMEMSDSKGRVLAKIDKVSVEDSKLDNIKLINGGIYYVNDKYKDVILDLTISTLKDAEGYFRFVDGAAVKIGEDIWFHFPEIVAKTRIVKISE